MLKKILVAVVVLVACLFIGVLGFIYLGPISSPSVLLHAIAGTGIDAPDKQSVKNRFRLPEGFRLGIFARDVPDARMMVFSPAGDLLVSEPRDGLVVLLGGDRDGDGKADSKTVLLSGLNRPHGIAIHGQWLYVAETDAVGRVPFDAAKAALTGDYRHVIDNLSVGGHWSKSITFDPDGKLYVSIGSSCNVCKESDPRRASIMRFDADGKNGEIYASGLRNSVGMDWAPWDHSLYATDNGRDMLGDDYPPCELNHIVYHGFYGWPYINGFGDLDPQFGKGHEDRLKDAISPVHGFRAHNAPLGIRFLHDLDWPAMYRDAALVALHGSWNRSVPDGYKVVSLHHQADGSFVEKDFLSGFEKDRDIIGRPVDIVQGPDQCVYISDDYAGVVYRVCYQAKSIR